MILLKNGTIVDPKTGYVGKEDILIEKDTIKAIGQNLPQDMDTQVIDCTNQMIGPGLVDVHVHFRDPGYTNKEDIMTGAQAAKRGGYTSVVLMANTNPVVDQPETISYVLEKGKKTGINIYTCATITKKMKGQELTHFKELLEAGAIGFTDDGVPILSEELAFQAMKQAVELGSVLSFHEEDPKYIRENGINHGVASKFLGIYGSDRQAEITMVERDLRLARQTGAKINIQHISSKEAVALIRKAKRENNTCNIFAEATPHHIVLTEEDVLKWKSLAKMNPPLRGKGDRQAIIEGLLDGTIDMIATDHAPHTKEEKEKELTSAPSGIIGLETALPLVHEALVEDHFMPFLQLFCIMSYNPAKMYQINAGFLAKDGPADLCIFDPNRRWRIEKFESKSDNSPFIGRELHGKVVTTICKGQIVYQSK